MNPLALIVAVIAGLSQTQTQVNLDDGLVAYYPFNGNANDESGNGHDGVISSGTFTYDKNSNKNSAFLFDGVDDSISVNNFNVLPSEGAISFWIYPIENENYANIFSTSVDSNGGTIRAEFNTNYNNNSHSLAFVVGSNSQYNFFLTESVKFPSLSLSVARRGR